MIIKEGIEYRNLEEQVRKNQEDIKFLRYGLNIRGRVNSIPELPAAAAIGDSYIVGTRYPYEIFTKVADPKDYIKVDLKSSLPGPKGDKGPKGDTGKGIDRLETIGDTAELAVYYTDGTVDLLDSLLGPVGPAGEQGPRGPRGFQGPKGGTYPLGETKNTCYEGSKGAALDVRLMSLENDFEETKKYTIIIDDNSDLDYVTIPGIYHVLHRYPNSITGPTYNANILYVSKRYGSRLEYEQTLCHSWGYETRTTAPDVIDWSPWETTRYSQNGRTLGILGHSYVPGAIVTWDQNRVYACIEETTTSPTHNPNAWVEIGQYASDTQYGTVKTNPEPTLNYVNPSPVYVDDNGTLQAANRTMDIFNYYISSADALAGNGVQFNFNPTLHRKWSVHIYVDSWQPNYVSGSNYIEWQIINDHGQSFSRSINTYKDKASLRVPTVYQNVRLEGRNKPVVLLTREDVTILPSTDAVAGNLGSNFTVFIKATNVSESDEWAITLIGED